MNVSRRTLLTGGVVAAATAGAIGYSEGVFDAYESKLRVANERATSTAVELVLSNRDAGQTVLGESFILASDEDFQRREVLSDDTCYRVTVEVDGDSTEKEFETCCRGYEVHVYVERDETQITLAHHD